MISIIVGKKGSGKTKYLVDHVNMAVKDEPGTLVFLGKDNRLMYDLSHSVRYIITEEFGIDNYDMFYGFICGIVSNNYDTTNIFVDSLWKIIASGAEGFEVCLERLDKISSQHNINFTIAISEDRENIPECADKYIVNL